MRLATTSAWHFHQIYPISGTWSLTLKHRNNSALRTGISSTIIPNVLDFENPPKISRKRTQIFRESIGLDTDDRMILQPTRIVQRKGIEFAIELVKELRNDRNKLVISHEAGDEGLEYAEWLKEYACEHGVDLRLVSIRIADPFSKNGNGKKTIRFGMFIPTLISSHIPAFMKDSGMLFWKPFTSKNQF